MFKFSDVMDILIYGFKTVFNWLSHFNIVGSISLLDIILAAMVVDMIITALFVTFNVSLSDSWAYDSEGNKTKVLTRARGSAHIGGR